MCTYNAISSHTDHYEIQKRDSEESLLTFVNLFPSCYPLKIKTIIIIIIISCICNCSFTFHTSYKNGMIGHGGERCQNAQK